MVDVTRGGRVRVSRVRGTEGRDMVGDVGSDEPGRALDVAVYEEALRGSIFERLARGVRAVGTERLKRNYTTTFWFARGAAPGHVVEEAIAELQRLAEPPPTCVGMEWWLGRLDHGQRLRFHFDRDMTLRKTTGQYVHPVLASALFLNAFPSSPLVVLDQVPSEDGRTKVPARPRSREAIVPVSNRYVVFPGNLRHGVIPLADDTPPDDTGGRRLSLLVNYWDRRPLPPLCRDYDGSIYARLREV